MPNSQESSAHQADTHTKCLTNVESDTYRTWVLDWCELSDPSASDDSDGSCPSQT